MKIFLCLHQFFPRFYTGTETLTLEVAEELKRRAWEVDIVTGEPLLPGDESPKKPQLRKDTYRGLEVWRFAVPDPETPTERLDRESNEYLLVKLFERLIAKERPDIVHIFHLWRLSISFVNTVKKYDIPVYFTPTDFWMLCPKYQLIRFDNSLCVKPTPSRCYPCLVSSYMGDLNNQSEIFKFSRRYPRLGYIMNKKVRVFFKLLKVRMKRHQRVFDMLDGVFWPNEFLRELFHKNKLRCRREKLNHFPVPERVKGLYDLPEREDGGVLHITYIGTLRLSKGPQILLEAVKKIGKDTTISVSIWGASLDPSFQTTLEAAAQNDNRINFRGTFPQEKLVDILNESDVVVVPALWYENTPLTALSVLAARRVLVASDLGGLASLVENGKNGFLFPPGDANELAKILVKLAHNRDLCRQVVSGITPPKRVKEYVEDTLSLYFSK